MALSAARITKEMVGGRKAYPVLANAVIYQGSIVVIDSNGRAKAGVTGTGLLVVGRACANSYLKGTTNTKGTGVWDATSLSNGAFYVEVEEGTFAYANSSDAVAITNVGDPCYVEDDQTVSATSGGSTQSPAGIVRDYSSTDGVWVEMSLAISRELTDSASWQASDADLTALAALSGTGLVAHTGVGTYAERTLTAPAAGLTIANPAGIAGNPTFALANDLAALEGLAATGLVARTADGAMSARTLSDGANITVTNPDGVAGNPSIAVTGTLPVTVGGLGVASPTDHAVLLGSGAAAVTPSNVGTDGQILLGATGADPAFATPTSSGGLTTTLGANSYAIAPTVVADDSLVGALPLFFTFNVSGGVTGNNDFVVTPKVEIIDLHLIKTNAAGDANDTVQLLVGGNAITNAISVNIADKTRAAVGTIDDAFSTINAGSTWRFTHTNGGGGASDTSCIAVVTALPRA